MYRTRRRALAQMSGIFVPVRPPRGGWHRNDPGDGGGDGSAGGGPAGGGANDGDGDGDDDSPGDGKKPKLDGDFDRERYERTIANVRAAEKKALTRAQEAEANVAARLLKAIGLTPDGKADPETQLKELTKERDQAVARLAELTTRDAIRTAAGTHKADAEALLDSTKFIAQLKELDTTADDYADKVGKLVARAVKENPAKYGSTSAKGGTGRSGTSDHTGGNGGRQRPGLGAAIAARMTN